MKKFWEARGIPRKKGDCILQFKRIGVLACCIMFTMSVFAQIPQVKINHFSVKNATLKAAISKLEKTVDTGFFYKSDEMGNIKGISLDMRNTTLKNVLESLLSGTGFTYEYVNGNIVITRTKQSVGSKPQSLQKIKVIVTDKNNGEKLIGATALVKGTSKGGITNLYGEVEIDKVAPNTVIEVRYIGKKTSTFKVAKNRTTYNITLEDNAVVLDELVVTTGYQTIERGRATGSFNIVKPDDLQSIVSNDFVDKLEGVVPGLSIDNNGEMMIRGQATIYAETKPLIVVDGFPMEYGTYNINSNDIEQISILKDAASASIWGVRAANGVIVITTKKGTKNQKAKVSYTGNLKIGTRFDVESLGYLNSAQLIDFEREYFANKQYISSLGNGSPSSYSEAAEIEYKYYTGEIDEATRDAAYQQLGSYDNRKDIEREFYRNSIFQSHNIVVSGGTQNMSNYLSVNYENTLSDLIGNNQSRLNFQFNNITNLSKKIKLTVGFRGNYADKDMYTGAPAEMRPYVHLKDANGNYVNEYRSVSQMVKDDLSTKCYLDWSYNRLKDRSETDNNTKSYNVTANAQLEFELPFGFKFTTSGMYTIDHAKQEILYKQNSYHVRNLFNEFTEYSEATGELTSHLPAGAIKDIYHNNSSSYTFRNVLNYAFHNDTWDVTAMAGCEMFSIRTQAESDTFYGFDPQGMIYDYTMNLYDLVNTGVPGYSPALGLQYLSYRPTQSDLIDRYFSTFATGSLSYKDLYTLFASIRYDKTNLYGRSGKYRDQPTWSVGGKWNISEESFFSAPFIDRLAVKLSYGLSGNVDKSTSPYLIAANARDDMTGLPCLIINNPENKELSWEKVYTTNFGFDLNMFRNRLNISADLYNRKTKDALGLSIMDPTTGWKSIKKNVASLINRGIDLSFGAIPVLTKDWNWNTTFTFSYNYNKVTKVNSSSSAFNSVRNGDPLEGKPVDYIYAFRTSKLDENGNLQIVNAKGEVGGAEMVNSFSMEDLLFPGRTSPKYFGAWSNTLSYKGFTLDWMFTYKMGHKMLMPSFGNVYVTNTTIYKTYDQRWRKPGDEETTWVPRSTYGMNSGITITAYEHMDHQIQSANLIRLKSLGLAYDFKHLLHSNWLSELRLKISAENLWFKANNRDGLDPDRMSIGDYGSTYLGDQPTYYTFTLNATF